MTWRDRLNDATYTPKTGQTIDFLYEDVSFSFDKKTSGFNFPGVDGTFVQDLGNTGRRIPINAIFTGDNNDLAANVFVAALKVKGEGTLVHPAYGTINVIPFGEIKQTNALKSAANQTIVTVVFWETTGVLFPTSQLSPADSVFAALDRYNTAMGEAFADNINSLPIVDRITQRNAYSDFVARTHNALKSVADFTDKVRTQFNAINNSINNGINLFIAQPLSLATQAILLIQAPSRAAASIALRLSIYKNLLDTFIIDPSGNVVISDDIANFKTSDLFASSYVTGSISSSLNSEFLTQSDAILTAEAILAQFSDLVTWRDDNFQVFEEIDTGEAYQQLQDAVALAVGFLVELSFSLKQERKIILTRPRSIVDLTAELYGEVDAQLDFLINSNNLTGSEILELPVGKEIIYFV